MPLQLLVDSKRNAETSIALSWCLDRQTIQEIQRNPDIREAYLLLIVVSKQGSQYYESRNVYQRQVVKLADPMTYIRFYKPGEHYILATICWQPPTHGNSPQSLIYRGRHGYRSHVQRYNLTEVSDEQNKMLEIFDPLEFPHREFAFLRVEVAAGHFAKQPPQWIFDWVNLYYETAPRDQCQFRNRAIWAFTLKPFYFLLRKLGRFVVGVFAIIVWALFAYREFRPLKALNPFADFDDATTNDGWSFKNSYLWRHDRDDDGDLGALRPAWLWPLTPIVPLLLAVVLFIVSYGVESIDWTVWETIIYAIAAVVTTAAVIGFGYLFLLTIFLLGTVISSGWKNWVGSEGYKSWRERKKEKEEAKNERRLQREAETRRYLAHVESQKLQVLSCDQGRTPDYQSLRREERTVRLRFLHAKAKICKSFSVR